MLVNSTHLHLNVFRLEEPRNPLAPSEKREYSIDIPKRKKSEIRRKRGVYHKSSKSSQAETVEELSEPEEGESKPNFLQVKNVSAINPAY